jgi:hypothetical protein
VEFIKNETDFYQISLNIKKGIYKCIGIGSGRTVYDLGNGYVVKFANNQKGIAQNKAESRISSHGDTNLFAKIIGVSQNFTYIVMEKAAKIKDMSYAWNFYNVKNNKELLRMNELQDVSYRYGLLLNDLERPANWGLINERPVIIDYGYTEEVRRKYYNHVCLL